MSWLLTVLNIVVNAAIIVSVGMLCWGIYRFIARNDIEATGDPTLAELLSKRTSRWSSRRVAVAYLDLQQRPATRMAFMGCDDQTPFELGTATESLTGLLIADAVQRGEVDLDSRLGELDHRLAAGSLADRTLRDLVTHTSGLPKLPKAQRLTRGVLSVLLGTNPYPAHGPDMIEVAGRQPLTPGFTHSPLGVALAGQVLARRAGVPFHVLLRERVLDPVGLADTSTDPATMKRVKRGWTIIPRHSVRWRLDGYTPAAGAVTTLSDLVVLSNALLRETAPGSDALTKVSAAAESGTETTRQGLLWQVENLSSTELGSLATKRRGRSDDPTRSSAVPGGKTGGQRGGKGGRQGKGARGQQRRRPAQLVWANGQSGGYSAVIALVPEFECGVVLLSDTAVFAMTRGQGLSILGAMLERS